MFPKWILKTKKVVNNFKHGLYTTEQLEKAVLTSMLIAVPVVATGLVAFMVVSKNGTDATNKAILEKWDAYLATLDSPIA
jgi:hypothetical protein